MKIFCRLASLLLLLQPVVVASFQSVSELSHPLDRRRRFYAYRRGGGGGIDDQPKRNGWDKFKGGIYEGIDSVNDLAKKLSGDSDKDTDRVEDGYSEFEVSLKRSQSPVSRVLGQYQVRAETLGSLDNTDAVDPEPSGFNSFKKNLYNAVDSFGNEGQDDAPGQPLLDRNVPYKRSLAQDFNNEDLASSNPIKRFQAEMEIRESEARRRAIQRGENVRAKKEDLYKLIDSFQAAVDSIPETIDKTVEAARETSEFIQSVPNRVEKTVEEVKSIPTKVQQTATKTKESVEEQIETTKKAVDDVKDIPNKVTKKIENTKRQVSDVKNSVDETVTNVKVFVGLEKPKPKPPKLPPPKDPTVQQFALDVAVGAANGAGKLTWWATKSVAGLAWNSAKSAIEAKTQGGANTPALEATSDNPSPTPETPIKAAKENVVDEPLPTIDLPTPTDTKEVEKEVADALRLAEASLRKASVEKNKKD